MKAFRIAAIPMILVLCVGMVLGQDAAHDVDKGAAKTGQIVKHVGRQDIRRSPAPRARAMGAR
jgi:hypothetical protein